MSENRIDADWLIGDVLDAHPETLQVFKKYFGEGCLTCPGSRLESISFGSTMHGFEAEAIVKEINERISRGK